MADYVSNSNIQNIYFKFKISDCHSNSKCHIINAIQTSEHASNSKLQIIIQFKTSDYNSN